MKKRVISLLLALLMVSSAALMACDNTTEPAETSISETEIAETAAPETAAPETAAPETVAPETAAPETAAPETVAPETAAPETAAPETVAPETAAPETVAPETAAPETAAPETVAPETAAPETVAPETAAPETAAPETVAPETAAPETTAPVQNTENPVDSLTINGAAIGEYVISCNASAGGVISYAASELQEYIAKATGVTLPIVEPSAAVGAKRIAIDETIVTDKNNFKYYSDSNGVVIAGSAERSALYAVYNFLENCIGWRFFTADTEICKEARTIDISGVNYVQNMGFEIRDIYYTEYFDKDISVKRYQNGEGKRRMAGDVHLGGEEVLANNGIHNIGVLTKSGDGSSPNPCLNSKGNLKRARTALLDFLKENPNEIRLHVSQNDNKEYCKCDDCLADIEYYGSPAGTLIEFVNQLCEDLAEKGYPDVKIVTFAYQYTFPCPENIVCHDNVIIELCTIDYCFNHAFNDPNCAKNAALMPEIDKWSAICKEFYIWDYVVNFKYYLAPFPNFDVIRENIAVMNAIDGMGLLEQGNYQTVSGEFGALRCYLLAKVMEKPDMTEEEYYTHMDEFLAAYYGPGWTNIRQYIDFITELSNTKNFCFGIYSSPEEIYGEHAFAAYSDQIRTWWETAEAMAETETQLNHIKQSRISADYIRIGAIFTEVMNSGDAARIEEMQEDYRQLYANAAAFGVTRIAENCEFPAYSNITVNPRSWWDLHEYKD